MSMIDTPMTQALSRFLDVDVACYKLITFSTWQKRSDTLGDRTRDLDFGAERRRTGMEAVGERVEKTPDCGAHAPSAPVVRQVRGAARSVPDGRQRERGARKPAVGRKPDGILPGSAAPALKDEFHGISQAINSGGGTSSCNPSACS